MKQVEESGNLPATGRQHFRPNARDPLVERLIGPGRQFELEAVDVAGFAQAVFKGAPRNLAGIYRMGREFGDRPFVVYDEIRLSFDDVFGRAASLATALREQFGVVRGTRVAIVMGNRVEWVISLIAITAAGGVAALVNSRGVAEEMVRAMATADCAVAIIDAERADIIAAEYPDPVWPRIVVGSPTTALRPGRDACFATLTVAAPGAGFDPEETDPADGAVILFTSGTTGFPKGALLSHGALAHAASLSCFMGALQDLRYEEETGESLPERSRSMTTPSVILGPMFHLSGMVPVIRSIGLGTTVHIMSKWNVDIAFDMIERVGMSRLSFVPAMLWDLLRSPRATPENLGEIRYMANGAAPLNPALVVEIRARMPNCLFSNTYGQTEDTAWACSISGKTYLEHPETCGWACPTVRVCVRRDDGSEAAIGEPGELWVSSAALMNEYVGDPDSTRATLQDGWLATGDVGVVDEKGLFTIVDRKKNMVISGGENIYCAEVERVLSDHPDVRESIAYGVPDPRLGERLAATVVLKPGASSGEDDIKAWCRQHLAIYKVPREVVLRHDLLPRTASGKIDRGSFLKRLHVQG